MSPAWAGLRAALSVVGEMDSGGTYELFYPGGFPEPVVNDESK